MYRDFTAADVDMAGLSLMAYAIGLPGFMLIKVLAPAFYARKDPRTPVRIAVIAMVTNIVLNVAFVVPMVKMNIPGPHAGLALATSVAAWVNAGLLFTALLRRSIYRPQAGWRRFFLQTGLAGGLLAGLLWWGVPDVLQWIGWMPVSARCSCCNGSPLAPPCISLDCVSAACGWRHCGMNGTSVSPWNWFAACITCVPGTVAAWRPLVISTACTAATRPCSSNSRVVHTNCNCR